MPLDLFTRLSEDLARDLFVCVNPLEPGYLLGGLGAGVSAKVYPTIPRFGILAQKRATLSPPFEIIKSTKLAQTLPQNELATKKDLL